MAEGSPEDLDSRRAETLGAISTASENKRLKKIKKKS